MGWGQVSQHFSDWNEWGQNAWMILVHKLFKIPYICYQIYKTNTYSE